MARRRRIFAPGYPSHVIQRGNNGCTIFMDETDRFRYLEFLAHAADRNDCSIHCYVLMDNHVHMLVSPATEGALGRTMQSLGVRYVHYFNRRHQRTGTLWDGRYWANIVDTDRYLVACYRYIELNPVRASLVRAPADWRWSSHRHHALGEPDPVVSQHDYYVTLASSSAERCARYRALLQVRLLDEELEAIRKAAREGLVLGEDDFKQRLEARLGHRVRPQRRGRRKLVSDTNCSQIG